MEEMSKDKLLGLIGALIRAADADLVNKRSCFPCKKEEHEFYKDIRNCFQQIYTEADFTFSNIFLNEVEGKSEKFIEMKAKLYEAPKRRQAHRSANIRGQTPFIRRFLKLCLINMLSAMW